MDVKRYTYSDIQRAHVNGTGVPAYMVDGDDYDALAAELATTQDLLPFSAQELAARAKALEADRDQISLTLAVANADRDKWFGRAKALEKEQWLIAECIFQNVSAGEMKHWAQGIKVSLSCADEVPRFTVERRGEMSGYTITLTDREYDALKDRIKALEAALWQLRERTKSPFLLDVIDKALASEQETGTELAAGCHRSHPHEDMDAGCQRLTEIARTNNALAREKP